jgi:hypothetical protein
MATEKRIFNADNWTVVGTGITCGICTATITPKHITAAHPELHRRRGAFLAHAARTHLHLLAGAFNTEAEYAGR